MAKPDSHPVRAPGAVLVSAFILVVFATVVAAVSLQLRGHWRGQVLKREGEVIAAVAAMERARLVDTARELDLPSEDEPFEVALQTSRNWRGVLAVRLFDVAGGFLDAVPVEIFEGALGTADLEALGRGDPVVRFHRRFRLSDLFMTGSSTGRAPLLEVNVLLAPPARTSGETVVAQYWIEGAELERELAAIDIRVVEQGLVAFVAGAVFIVGSLAWGYGRVRRAQALLRTRAEDLARANRELAQSARTSAIGAITAHLMHGLRNPLSGLESFVAAQGAEGGDAEEWVDARESTRRLRAIVTEVQAVLSDVQTGTEFEVTSTEVCAGLRERLQAGAAQRAVRIEVSETAVAVLDSKTAGLGGLVLANLAQNAIGASLREEAVFVTVGWADGFADFVVADRGPGLPEDVAREPFKARRSTKPDGAGIGLTISRELARNAGGELSLVRTSPHGTSFRLRLPATVSRAAGEVR